MQKTDRQTDRQTKEALYNSQIGVGTSVGGSMHEGISLPRVLFADTAVPGGRGCRTTTLGRSHRDTGLKLA